MKSILFLSIMLASAASQAQYSYINKFDQECDWFEIDNISNLYLKRNEEIIMLNEKLELVGRYSNNGLGDIHSLDVTNPLKIVLFYRDLSQVVMLDRFMAERTRIPLEEKGLEQTKLVCKSNNGGVWLYDLMTYELYRIDERSNVLSRSGNVNQVIGRTVNPEQILEVKNWVYVNDSSQGLFVFDVFGAFSKRIPIKNLQDWTVIDEQLIYKKGTEIHYFNLETLDEVILNVPLEVQGYSQIKFRQNKLYFGNGSVIKIYQLKSG